APAEFVTIVDTLSADLDPNTLEVLETSSDSTFSFTVEGQVVTFRFVGIDLPPNVIPPEGEGFVSFTLQQRPGLEEGTAIDNRASIVFDFNPPILTPTVTYELRAVADLDVAVAAMPEQNVGETATFEVQVANVTTDEAMEAELVIVPPDAPLVSVTPSVGTCTGTMPIVCDLGTLAGIEAGGDIVTVEVVVETEAKGELTLSASATTSAFDGFLPNNSAAASVNVVTVGTETESGLPTAFTLDAVYPNPTARDATVRYGLPEADRVDLVVYDLLGRRVAVLADDAPQPAGWHTATLDTSRLASGVYVCQLRAGGITETRKLTVLR
ncbi:MAG: T9SS type A sorting domain-containing protein, partial [Bacteroidota bacterium]